MHGLIPIERVVLKSPRKVASCYLELCKPIAEVGVGLSY